MKRITFMIASAAVFLLASCSKEPKACFTVEVKGNDGKWVQTTTGKVGERFYFSPMCSKNIFVGTVFDYGDGTTGMQEGHEYVKPGTYTVKCTVFAGDHGQKGEKTDVSTQTVTVKAFQADAGGISTMNKN